MVQPNQEASGLIIPVRREYAAERRHEVDISTVWHRSSFLLTCLRVNKSNLLCPTDSGSSCLNSAFECVVGVVIKLVAHGGQQAIIALNGLVSNVCEDETACTISVLDFSLLQSMAKASCLLVSQNAPDRNSFKFFDTSDSPEISFGRLLDFGEPILADSCFLEHLF